MNQLILKPGREKSVLQRHPWIFSGAIESVFGNPQSGETVDVISSKGDWLCIAAFSPVSQIRARIWSSNKGESVDDRFFENRISRSIERRRQLGLFDQTDAVRLVHGESDGLPGLVADCYGDTVVVQNLSAGMELWKQNIARILQSKMKAKTVLERSDVEVRKLEGLSEASGVLIGEAPGNEITITEYGIKFIVDVIRGQKTGFYLDQRENRRLAGSLLREKRVLNCFSYSGGFSVQALVGGANEVISIDSSRDALETGRRNLNLNGLSENRATWLEADVFTALRTMRDKAEKFDAIILDPPKFAPTAAHAEKAARAYKDINLLAFKLLKPGGLLFTFSCSGGINLDLFQKIVAGASLDAGIDARIIHWMHQAPDHPVALNFPEGSYLKGLLCTAG
jgi:23S rRNA (cytosine1962-C5)-methyltransferase